MAKFECTIPAVYDFDDTLKYFHDHLSKCGVTASYEGGSDYRYGDFRVAVRVYERYTVLGDNRLSLTVTLASAGEEIFASAIAAAGGGGMVKIWDWGEKEFLQCFQAAAEMFEGMKPRTGTL